MENARARSPILEDYVFRSRVTDFRREVRGETILHEMAHMWFGDLVYHALVGRPVAERVVSRPGRSTAAQAEATRWTQAWTTFTTAH